MEEMLSTLQGFQKMMGQLIKVDRIAKNKTLIEVAETSGINIRILQAVEAGQIDLKLSHLWYIFMAIGINPAIEVSRLIYERSIMQV